jgi:hypothetical protein
MQAHYLARSGILIAKKYLLEQEKTSLLSVDGIHYYYTEIFILIVPLLLPTSRMEQLQITIIQ